MIRAAMPDFHTEIEDLIAEDDRVAWRYSSGGTHTGAPLFGVPASSQEHQMDGHSDPASRQRHHQGGLGQRRHAGDLHPARPRPGRDWSEFLSGFGPTAPASGPAARPGTCLRRSRTGAGALSVYVGPRMRFQHCRASMRRAEPAVQDGLRVRRRRHIRMGSVRLSWILRRRAFRPSTRPSDHRQLRRRPPPR